jgi:integrase
MFRWATAEEMLPASVHQALDALTGLRRGRSAAREPEPVLPVSDEIIEATLPHLPTVVAYMVRFQRLTGCRPSEVCMIRPGDVDTSTKVWQYIPQEHKTQHHGKQRIIFIGPKAQDILRPYLLRPAESYCFSPVESERKRLDLAHESRVTPLH